MTEPRDYSVEWIEYTPTDFANIPETEWIHYTIERNTSMNEPKEVYMDLWQCLAAIWRGIWKRK